MQNLNLSKQKFLLKIQKLNLKMLKLKKPRKYLRKFSWIDAQKKALHSFSMIVDGEKKTKKLKMLKLKKRGSTCASFPG